MLLKPIAPSYVGISVIYILTDLKTENQIVVSHTHDTTTYFKTLKKSTHVRIVAETLWRNDT